MGRDSRRKDKEKWLKREVPQKNRVSVGGDVS